MLYLRRKFYARAFSIFSWVIFNTFLPINISLAQEINRASESNIISAKLENETQNSYISEKETVIKSWVSDVIRLAKDPQAAITELDLQEKQLDARTRDRMWAFVTTTGLKSEVGRFTGKPIINENIRTLRRLYLSALDGNSEAIVALEAYSNSNDAVMGFYAKNVLANYFATKGNRDRFLDTVHQMITYETRLPDNRMDEYNIILMARLQEKAVFTKDALLVLETTRNSMVERYRLGLGEFSASDLYNLFHALFTVERLADAEMIIEAMKALSDGDKVEDLFTLKLSEAILNAKNGNPKESAELFDEIIPLAKATGRVDWADVTYAYAAREYAIAGDFETARLRQSMTKAIPQDQLPYADLVDFEEAVATGDIKAAEMSARKLIEFETARIGEAIAPASWSRYKMYENEAKRNAALSESLSLITSKERDLKKNLSGWKWFATLLLALLAGVGVAVFTLIRRASFDLKLMKNADEQTSVLQKQLKAETQKATALSKLLESTAEEISSRLTPSMTLIEFATHSDNGKELPFANEAMAALRSFSVLSLDMAAIAGGKLPKPTFEAIDSQNIETLLRRRLHDHMDGDASCDIRVRLSDDVPQTMVMDCDRVLHIVMCLVAGAWKRSSPAPVQVDCDFDSSKGFLQVDVVDVGGVVPANIEDQFSQLPSNSDINTEHMLLRMQYAAADKLVEAMGGTIEFNGNYRSSLGLGLKATVYMPVILQTSEEGTPSYVVTAPG